MTLFGIIWILLIFFCFLHKDIKYMLFLTIISMLIQCSNVFNFPNLRCGPQIITSFAFIIKSLLYKDIDKEVDNNNMGIPLLIIYIFINYLLINSNSGANILNLIQIAIYTITFIRIKIVYKFISDEFIDKCIKYITYIILFVGFFNIFINLLGLSKNNIIGILLFNDSKNPNIYYYMNSTRFYSTFMEPSYVAGLLCGLFLYYHIKCNELSSTSNILIEVLLGLAIILTKSSTAYGTFLIIMSTYYLKNIKKRSTWFYIFAGIIIFALIFTCTDILNQVIFKKSVSSSARVREIWNNQARNAFYIKPIFGNGYKTLRASSLYLNILGELGAVGLIIYFNIIRKFLFPILHNKDKKNNIIYNYLVLALIISQLIACPDLDLCSFWLVMYIYKMNSVHSLTNKYKMEEKYEKY